MIGMMQQTPVVALGIFDMFTILFITKALHTSLLFSALILLWRAAPTIAKAVRSYKESLRELASPQGSLFPKDPPQPHEHHISISVHIFASILAMTILSIGFGSWGSLVQSVLPGLETATLYQLDYAWQITRVFGLITLFMLCWQLHAVCRGVTTLIPKHWRMEQEMIVLVLGVGVLLTAVGL